MPKRISNRIDFWLMAYKGAKPAKAKVSPTVSGYQDVSGSSFNGPFGSGSSSFGAADPVTGKKQIDTSMSLSAPLQQAGNTASTGLNDNLAYLQRDPTEQVNHLTSGQDPLYNVLHEQSQRAYDQNLGRLHLDAQQAGGSNSTAAGAAYGRLMGDKGLIDNQNLYQGLSYGNQTATQNAGTNLGAIGNLAQLTYPLGSAANAQLNTAVQGQDRAQAATAQSQNTAENNYTASNNQYNQQKQAALWSAIGGTLSGGLAGGLSAYGGAMSPQGAYVPQQFGGPSSNFGAINPGYSNPFGAGSGTGAMFNTSGINGMQGGFGAIDPSELAMAVV